MVFRSAKFASKANFQSYSEYIYLILLTDTISTLDYLIFPYIQIYNTSANHLQTILHNHQFLNEFPLFFCGIPAQIHTIKNTSFLSTEHNVALLANDMEPKKLLNEWTSIATLTSYSNFGVFFSEISQLSKTKKKSLLNLTTQSFNQVHQAQENWTLKKAIVWSRLNSKGQKAWIIYFSTTQTILLTFPRL
jgi:hypothetical protein